MTTTPPNHIHFLLVARKEQMNDFPVKQRRNDEVKTDLLNKTTAYCRNQTLARKHAVTAADLVRSGQNYNIFVFHLPPVYLLIASAKASIDSISKLFVGSS
jgi:hypothetical protein